MSDLEDIVTAIAIIITVAGSQQDHHRRHPRRFWVRPEKNIVRRIYERFIA